VTVRTAELGHGFTVIPGAGVIVATVPVGHVWLLRSAALWNNGALTGSAVPYVDRAGDTYVLANVQLAALAAETVERFWALEAGDQLGINSVTTTVKVWFSGADLVL
jgi:hypothetical protein